MRSDSASPEVPKQLLDALAREPSETRPEFLRSRTTRIWGVGIFWALCAVAGLMAGTPHWLVLLVWMIVPIAAWLAIRQFEREGEYARRNLALIPCLGGLAVFIGVEAPHGWVSLHPTCFPLMAFMAAPALHFLGWASKHQPTSTPVGTRFWQAALLCLGAGVPVSVICQEHDAPHLWLTHLLPALVMAALYVGWLNVSAARAKA